MDRPDAIVFCISQQHLSARREQALAQLISDACPSPMRVVRLEGTGPNLAQALDALSDAGHGTILVQPLGFPFSQSLAAWLPGVLAHWRIERGAGAPKLYLGNDARVADVSVSQLVAAALAAEDAVPVETQKPSLGKPGWNDPPAFKHHLLVCTGPRCHYHGAPNLAFALNEALLAAGVRMDCLIATTGCLYPCNKGPVVAVYPLGEWYRLAEPQDVERFVQSVIVAGVRAPELLVHQVQAHSSTQSTQGRIS